VKILHPPFWQPLNAPHSAGMNAADLFLPAALCRSQFLAIDASALASVLQQFQAAAKQRQLDAPAMRVDPLARTSHKYSVDANGTAQFDLVGIILDEADSFLDWLGMDYVVTSHFAAAIRAADADANIKAIAINADTPGGSVVGLQAAYEAIRDAVKPVTVAVTGMLASAGVYVTAAADKIIAEPAAIVGSIGTMTTMTDVSEMAARLGIKVHLIASGPQKGTGTAGVPITAERIAPMQDIVNELANQFKAVIVEGRGLSTEAVDALATGAAWLAPRALELGLIDAISSNPAATAATATKEFLMLTKEQYKALLAAHSAHLALIDKLDSEGKDEAAIKSAIVDADNKANLAAIADLKAQLETAEQANAAAIAAANTAHETTKTALAAEQAKVTALEAKVAKITGVVPKYNDPGNGLPPPAALEKTQTEFDAMSPSEKSKFYGANGTVVADK
jgi:protease-4